MNRRLYRSRTDSVIGGVAGGVAEYLDVDPSIVRIVWAVLAIVTGGIFFVLYIVMWIVVPENPGGVYAPPQPGPGAQPGWVPPSAGTPDSTAADVESSQTAAAADAGAPPPPAAWAPPQGGYPEHRRRRGGSGAMIFGLILVGLGVWFLLDEYVPGLDTDLLWPIGLVLLGGALLFVSMRNRSTDS